MLAISPKDTLKKSYWTDLNNYHRSWSNRAVRAAAMIRDAKWVADIGCGRMDLCRYLAPNAIYLPSDIVAWKDDVEVCDLNEGNFPDRSLAICDVAVLLGVVERIKDLPSLFSHLSGQAERVLVSYHNTEPDEPRDEGWVHWYSAVEFRSILDQAGYGVVQVVSFGRQKIWLAKSRNFTLDEARLTARSRFTGERPSLKMRLTRLVSSFKAKR